MQPFSVLMYMTYSDTALSLLITASSRSSAFIFSLSPSATYLSANRFRTSSYCKSGSISPSSLLTYITTQVWVSRLMLIILSNDSLTEW